LLNPSRASETFIHRRSERLGFGYAEGLPRSPFPPRPRASAWTHFSLRALRETSRPSRERLLLL